MVPISNISPRVWVATYASEQTLGGVPTAVGPSAATDPAARKELEIDVVACAGDRVIALGEAKWTRDPVGHADLTRLERKKTLLGARAQGAKLLLFSRSGFQSELRIAARKKDLELVDPERLYRGR